MKIIFQGNPKEIAALVVGLQGQREAIKFNDNPTQKFIKCLVPAIDDIHAKAELKL